MADTQSTSGTASVTEERPAFEPGKEAEPAGAFEGTAPEFLAPEARSKRRFLWLRRLSHTGFGVWSGLVIVAAGFGLLAYTWSQTAALVNVALQVPFLVSGGLIGLGLILVGLVVISLAVRRREALERRRQLEEVSEALIRLRTSIEGESEDT